MPSLEVVINSYKYLFFLISLILFFVPNIEHKYILSIFWFFLYNVIFLSIIPPESIDWGISWLVIDPISLSYSPPELQL